MNRIAVALIVALGAMSSPVATAGEATISWTIDNTRTDGSTIPAAQRRGTRVEWGSCASSNPLTFGTKAGEAAVPVGQSSYVVTGLAAGTYCFRAFTLAVTAAGTPEESETSNVATKTLVAAPPSPPGALTVTSPTVYAIVKQVDRFVFVAVGTVPPDTQCDPEQTVNGKFVVPRAAATWSGTVKPDVIVADCS